MDSRTTCLEEDMVEKVAKEMFAAMQKRFHTGKLYDIATDVLSEELWNKQPEIYKNIERFLARAAIEAMRIPTEAMILAAHDALAHTDYVSIGDDWGPMIDAALTSRPKTSGGGGGSGKGGVVSITWKWPPTP